MESDLTLFLEFYGLPGCGKSTASHMVAAELRKQGKNVSEPTFDMDHKSSGKVRKVKKLLKLFRYAVAHPKKYKALKTLVSKNGYGGSGGLSQCANITQKLLAYEHEKSDVVIFDEGLTQSSISLSQGRMNAAENEKELFALCPKRNVKKIYVNVSPEVALKRMEGRSQHDSRIEKIEDPLLRENAMVVFHVQCDLIPNGNVIQDGSAEQMAAEIITVVLKESTNH